MSCYVDQFLDVLVENRASELSIIEDQPPSILLNGGATVIREEWISSEEFNHILSDLLASPDLSGIERDSLSTQPFYYRTFEVHVALGFRSSDHLRSLRFVPVT